MFIWSNAGFCLNVVDLHSAMYALTFQWWDKSSKLAIATVYVYRELLSKAGINSCKVEPADESKLEQSFQGARQRQGKLEDEKLGSSRTQLLLRRSPNTDWGSKEREAEKNSDTVTAHRGEAGPPSAPSSSTYFLYLDTHLDSVPVLFLRPRLGS